MKAPSKNKAIDRAVKAIAEFLNERPERIAVNRIPRDSRADATVKVGDITFIIKWTGTKNAGAVAFAIEQLLKYVDKKDKKIVPLVAVPFMGETGEELCSEAGVSWLDLSGNARIIGPRFRIIIKGNPNLFKRRGRPSSVFAPKSSRIPRRLLMEPDKAITQRELAQSADMDEGFTSRIVAKLEEDNLIIRNKEGAIKPRDPDLLLDAWREEYDFEKHVIIRGHVPARSGSVLAHVLADEFKKTAVYHAATGLAAAWLMDRFAGFRITTFYLREGPSPELLERISFRKDEQGANTWLVIPADEGFFHGSSVFDGVLCVHPVQTYLDLKGHPERSEEAAESLRSTHMKWSKYGGKADNR